MKKEVLSKLLTQAAKFKIIDEPLMHNSMNKLTKKIPKITSFINYSKSPERHQPDLMDHIPEPFQQIRSVPLWDRQTFPTLSTPIPDIRTEGIQPGHVRRDTAL